MPIGCEARVAPQTGIPLGVDDYDGLFGEGEQEIDESQPQLIGMPRETEEYIPSDSTNFDQY